MATSWEIKKQQAEAQANQRKAIRGVTGTITEEFLVKTAVQSASSVGGATANIAKGFNAAAALGSAIEFVGAVGVAAWQAVTNKRAATKRRRLTREQNKSQEDVDLILATIGETGSILVQEHGIDPTTSKFEQLLFDNLYKEVGYTGNCNIQAKIGANNPVLFKVSKNGRVFENISMMAPLPNIQTYWRVKCKSLRDLWASSYQDLLIREGRIQELEDFQTSYHKGKKIIQISFGILFGILAITSLKYGAKIK